MNETGCDAFSGVPELCYSSSFGGSVIFNPSSMVGSNLEIDSSLLIFVELYFVSKEFSLPLTGKKTCAQR